jgi:hypothetical protein
MAAAFAESGIRVTPSGIFRGRDAIRRNLQDVLNMGLHAYTGQRTVSRSEGTFVFNAGEWRAKLGDQPLRCRAWTVMRHNESPIDYMVVWLRYIG